MVIHPHYTGIMMAVNFNFTLDDEAAEFLIDILRDHATDLRTKAWQGGFSDAQAKMLETHAKYTDGIKKIMLEGQKRVDKISA